MVGDDLAACVDCGPDSSLARPRAESLRKIGNPMSVQAVLVKRFPLRLRGVLRALPVLVALILAPALAQAQNLAADPNVQAQTDLFSA